MTMTSVTQVRGAVGVMVRVDVTKPTSFSKSYAETIEMVELILELIPPTPPHPNLNWTALLDPLCGVRRGHGPQAGQRARFFVLPPLHCQLQLSH